MAFLDFYIYFTTFFILTPLIILAFKFKKLTDQLKIIFYILLISILVEITNLILINFKTTVLPVLNIYTILEFSLISMFYYYFYKSFSGSIVVLLLMFAFIVFSLYMMILKNKFFKLDEISSTISCIVIMLYCLFSYVIIMLKMPYDNLLNEPFFWINNGFLIYFSGNLFFFALGNHIIQQQKEINSLVYYFHPTYNFLNYLLISIGIIKYKI